MLPSAELESSKLGPSLSALMQSLSSYIQDCNNGIIASVFTEHNMSHLWQNRLGHVPSTKLKKISCKAPDILQSKIDVYITCSMAKFTKLLFPLSSHHSERSFDLIHMDIWGPYKAVAHKKYRYFLTLIDDYSRAT